MNLIEEAKTQIDNIINTACNEARRAGKLPDGEPLSGAVEIPRDRSHGDYAATHAMAAAKQMRQAPRKIAEALAEHINLENTDFHAVSIAGAGFLNFTVSDFWYSKVLQTVEKTGDAYGSASIGSGASGGNGKRVMVEFVSANPTGPMTVGNARGAVLGDTLASVLQKAGYDVWREFYLNDTGNQVDLFGKSIEARYLELCPGTGSVEFPEDGYHGEDIKELARTVFEQNADNLMKLSEAERRAKLVEFGLEHNVTQMKQHLERYHIHFDEWFSEKKMHDSGYVADTVDRLDKAGLLYERDGALWLRNTVLGGDKDEVLRKSNGFYTYYAADIAYHRNKLERGFDRVIDIWGADHHGHAKRLMATMTSGKLSEALGINGSGLHFLLMQMMRIIRDGEAVKVSKRTGKALTLNDLLDEINVDACRFFFNARADSQLDFDINLAVRQDSENPVYYVQYAHARICSLIAMLAADGYSLESSGPDCAQTDYGLLTHDTERELIRQIALLPEEIALAARDLDPSRINRYAIELASRFHKFYASCRIKGEEGTLTLARLKLAAATRMVIKICLDILGVSAPEKM